ncbi:hypothetical protein EI94DRAFT_1703964 [Lactarius quietus]|nr:hypothetical protein EI94DRAFT_1703964 [Lactarius quietus]
MLHTSQPFINALNVQVNLDNVTSGLMTTKIADSFGNTSSYQLDETSGSAIAMLSVDTPDCILLVENSARNSAIFLTHKVRHAGEGVLGSRRLYDKIEGRLHTETVEWKSQDKIPGIDNLTQMPLNGIAAPTSFEPSAVWRITESKSKTKLRLLDDLRRVNSKARSMAFVVNATSFQLHVLLDPIIA